jgi:hypothetical protein
MTSLHYESHPSRPAAYSMSSKDYVSSAYDLGVRHSSSSSMMSGLKSIFCSKSSSSSTRHHSSAGLPLSSTIGGALYSRQPLASRSSHTATYPRREVVRVKTSDSFPVISPQLEDRMLQLADRSRRLGVHRFSRTRDALVLNLHPPVCVQQPAPVVAPRFARGGSTTSTSTQSSTRGTIQKVALPKVSVRE